MWFWFRVFVLLRTPVSALLILGYGIVNGVLALGAYVFLGVVSIKLVRGRKGALQLAGWLLALETMGAVLLVSGRDYIATRAVDPLVAFAVACVAIVVWTAPNAFAFYKARALFTEPEKQSRACDPASASSVSCQLKYQGRKPQP